MSYKITRLARQIMEIKEGKKHNQQKSPKQPKKQLLGSPLLAIAGCTLKTAFWDMFWNFGHEQEVWNYCLTKKNEKIKRK